MFRTNSGSGPIFTFLDGCAKLCVVVAGSGLVTLIAIFGWLVFGRYVLNDTPTWVEQLALVLVVWITFLGAAAGVWHKDHLSIDFVRESFPNWLRVPLRWLAVVGVTIFGGFLAYQGYVLADKTWPRLIPMLGINEGWRAVPMAVCGALTVIFSLYHMVQMVRDNPNPTGEE
jgi:TRAP-type C4-dicarboxylate transport system permease small subunit